MISEISVIRASGARNLDSVSLLKADYRSGNVGRARGHARPAEPHARARGHRRLHVTRPALPVAKQNARASLPLAKNATVPPAPTHHAADTEHPLPPVMALQVAGGAGCCGCLPLLGPRSRRAAAFLPPRAVASDGPPAVEDGSSSSKTMLGGSGVAVTKLGIGAWSWGDTTYWNDFQWDGTCASAIQITFLPIQSSVLLIAQLQFTAGHLLWVN